MYFENIFLKLSSKLRFYLHKFSEIDREYYLYVEVANNVWVHKLLHIYLWYAFNLAI